MRQPQRHRSSSWNDDAGSVGNRDSSGREDGIGRRHSSRQVFPKDSPRRTRAEPTIATTMSDLTWIIYGYTRQLCQYIARYSSKLVRTWAIVLLIAIVAFAATMGILFLRFLISEIIPICTPPRELNQMTAAAAVENHPPLVEYYVHGRGNGHYARSVAIVEQLLSKGVDVRMFIGRATMWRAINEAATATATASQGSSEKPQEQFHSRKENKKRGQLTVTSVASLLPTVSILDSISLALERVLNDCEVAKSTNRYPLLVISDGDLPGMWRARFGSIPSVSVSHGQTFVIGQIPAWVAKDKDLSNAWEIQRVLNSRTSKGADWLIATNFVDIPVIGGNGVVARSPIRPEVIRMGQERYQRKQNSFGYMDESGNVLLGGSPKLVVENSFMDPWQRETINELLFGKDVAKSLQVVGNAILAKQISPLFAVDEDVKLIRRKLVICYFRDKNGDLLTNALLKSGFDVLLFERGYHKGLSDHEEEKKLGQDLIVRQSRKKRSAVNDVDEESSLRDHWVHILQEHNKHLLDDSRTSTTAQADQGENNKNSTSNNNSNIDSHGDEVLEESEENTMGDRNNIDNRDIPTIQEAVETVTSLLKSTVEDPRIIRVTDMSLFVPLLSIADGVASSAGSQLLSECIYSHLNVLALYREDDTEQMLNIEFSKHRFDHLSKDKQKGMNDADNVSSDSQESTENVVHGMSLENFAKMFETISRHTSSTNTNTHGKRETILITEPEEATILRTPKLKQSYNEFKKYITAVRHSPISWSYYHDVAHGILKTKNTSSVSETVNKNNDNTSMPRDDHKKRAFFVDPFQGMPDAASVIIEILEDLMKNSPNNNK